jgi:CDP-diacylglycerol---glycerol-3-phosphate 3-phosphatidyltransferase
MLKVLRPAIARILTPAGQVLARTPVTPNALTIIGTIGMSAGALTLFPTGHLFAGVMVCTGFVLTDMLDGTLARIKGTTGKFGAFLDSTMDRIADAAVFVGLAVWFLRGGHDKVLAGVAVFCLVAGALVSYAKARAESLGLTCDVGFAERTERLLIALVAAGLSGLGVPYVLPIGLWLLAAASAFTFGQRVRAARQSAAQLAAADRGAPTGAGHASDEAADSGAAGSETAGSEAAGSEAAGSEAAGSEAAGSEAAGSEAAGSEAAGSEAAGSEAAGSDAAGPDTASSHSASRVAGFAGPVAGHQDAWPGG